MSPDSRHSILDTILEHKRETELPLRKQAVSLTELRRQAEALTVPACDFGAALYRQDRRVALIAEVKRASPSKGLLVKGEFNPIELARTYESSGASAISVLTDERFFLGALDHLAKVRKSVGVPVLRKDFIVDPYQLYEARVAGADAVLLIVAALEDTLLSDLHRLALQLTLTPLVEVHNEDEIERALRAGASIIGVNNRDLNTFVTDISTTAKCARLLTAGQQRNIPPAISGVIPHPIPLLVSESGIFTSADVARVSGMGACAVLVGESIITSGSIPDQVKALSGVLRKDVQSIPQILGGQ